ncbi:MAG: MotA/TolQ/ExbB proton channel family protein, partial [Gemmataceae bacterium]
AVGELSMIRQRRSGTVMGAVLLGLPLAAGMLALAHQGPLQGTVVQRYLQHPVEVAELVLFCCAMGALAIKMLGYLQEKMASRVEFLPRWDGKPVAVQEASYLLAEWQQLPRRQQQTLRGCRVANILDFVRGRGSAAQLDDQMRALADNDAMTLEGSYSFIRFLAWAIPILGFLGTVLGITQAISGVSPEMLEKNLNKVTDGLATAFDTTALALGLTMIVMFLHFVVERAEQSTLDGVDRYVDQHLAHRFERLGEAGQEVTESIRQHSQLLLRTVDELMRRQVTLWAESLEEIDQRRAAIEQRLQHNLCTAVEAALARSLETHSRRLSELENQSIQHVSSLAERLNQLAASIRETGREQTQGLTALTQRLTTYSETLSRLQTDEKQLVRMQEVLQQNLSVLAGTGTLDQAIHSLTAAIHLMTARASASPTQPSRLSLRSGEAA